MTPTHKGAEKRFEELRRDPVAYAEWRRTHPRIAGGAPLQTAEEFENRQNEIRSRLEEINEEYAGQALPEDTREEWNNLNEEREANDTLIEELRARETLVRALEETNNGLGGGGAARGERGASFHTNVRKIDDPYDLIAIRNASRSPEAENQLLRENAERVIDQSHFPHPDARRADAQQHITALLERFTGADDTGADAADFSRRILTTGSPLYKRAFAKATIGKALTTEESRALSLAVGSGGYAVPFTLDPTIIPTSNYSVNPYRRISRVETINTTTWQGITSAGVTVNYAAELTEATDDAPSIAQPTATPVRVQAFIPFSIEIGQDWGAIQQQMAMLVQDGKDDAEANKFTVGSGTNEPQGLLTGATNIVTGAGTGTYAIADLYTLEQSLPARFRARGTMLGNRVVYNNTRQFDTGGGGGLWMQLPAGLNDGNAGQGGNLNAELLGYPANEVSAMSNSIATGNKILAIGDFRYFLIVDRVGMDVELIPHLFGTNRRPTGQRGLYFFWRNTSVVLSANAFRVLQVK